MEWTVVTVLIALAGLGITVGKPVVALNNSITRLTARLDAISDRLEAQEEALRKQQASAHESHSRLWAHNTRQDQQLADQEQRLNTLETEHHLYH